ncbi:hypothetical protein DTW91_06115 [Chryseobacterium sp. SC28]|nr:hypothetical protein DTW91_06115 [Chryseobacterium sp. SC28]
MFAKVLGANPAFRCNLFLFKKRKRIFTTIGAMGLVIPIKLSDKLNIQKTQIPLLWRGGFRIYKFGRRGGQ